MPERFTGLLRLRPAFARLWLGQAVSALGDQIFTVAIAVLVVTRLRGSATDLGIVLGARVLAAALFVIAGGVWSDRLRRTRLMIGTDVVRGAAVFALAATPTSFPPAALAAMTFVLGSGESFFRPAYRSLVPDLVDRSQLPEANALTTITLRTASLVGPGIAGLIVSIASVRWALWADVATFLVSSVTLATISDQPVSTGPRRSALVEAREGFRAIRRRSWAAALLVADLLLMLFAVAPWTVLLPVVALHRLGGSRSYGLILSLFAAGGICGALVAVRWHPRRPGLAALLCQATFAGCLVSLAWFSEPAVAVLAVVAGAGTEIYGILWTSALQRAFERDLLGRVMAISSLGSLAFAPLGMALAGPAASALGTRAVLLFGAGVLACCTAGLIAVPGVSRLGEHVQRDVAAAAVD